MVNKTFEDIAVKLHSQDNRCTSHPMFVVRQVRRIYGIDINWGGCDGPDDETAEKLNKMWENEEEFDERLSYERTGYTDIFEFVTCCFTNDAAEAYIADNKHNLNKPHVYVASGYRNQEWIDMRAALMELPVKVPD
jgi:hypothetical protein